MKRQDFLFDCLFSVSYYDYSLFPIFFRDKWFRCGAVLSYAEKHHCETNKRSGIVLGLFSARSIISYPVLSNSGYNTSITLKHGRI